MSSRNLPPSYASTNIPTCCTCACFLLSEVEKSAPNLSKTEHANRQLECCRRFICGRCIDLNPRFAHYCPFCQTSTKLESSFSQLPPSYSPPEPLEPGLVASSSNCTDPPPYQSVVLETIVDSKGVIHYLRSTDSVLSLSLLYNIPPSILRSANGLFADNLLSARRWIFIPFSASFPPGSLSQSPHPVNPDEEDSKTRLKRFQLQTKCVDYKMAQWYLSQAGGSEKRAVEMWRDDEAWEKSHPNVLKDSRQMGKVRR